MQVAVGRLEAEPLHRQLLCDSRYIALCQPDEQLRILYDCLLGKVAAFCGKAVQIGSGIIEIHILPPAEFFHRLRFSELHTFSVHLCAQSFRFFSHVDAKFRCLFLYKSLKVSLSGMNRNMHTPPRIYIRLQTGGGMLAVAIGFGRSVVIILRHLRMAIRVQLVDTHRTVYLVHIIVRICHRDDGSVSYKHGEFPKRCFHIVQDTVSFVRIACEVVYPRALGQINAVADIVSSLICLSRLKDRRNQKVGTVHILVTGGNAVRIIVRIVEEHSPDKRLAVYRLFGVSISIGQQLRFQLQIHAVDRSGGFAEGMRIFLIRSPSVHIELHGRERFPLEVANIHHRILSAENAIHVRRYIRLTRETRTDIGRNMEADIFPYTSCLISGPDGSITLRSRPAVERNDERTSLVAIVRHDMSHIRHTVQAERIAGSHPCHVCFQHTYARIAHLFHNVALQQRADACFRMQIRLCPKPDLHSVLTGIITQTPEVSNVSVEGFRLPVTGSVSIIGQQPPQRHVVLLITVDHRPGRKLIIVFLSIE